MDQEFKIDLGQPRAILTFFFTAYNHSGANDRVKHSQILVGDDQSFLSANLALAKDNVYDGGFHDLGTPLIG